MIDGTKKYGSESISRPYLRMEDLSYGRFRANAEDMQKFLFLCCCYLSKIRVI